MASWQAHLTSFVMRHSVKPRLTAANSVAEIRDLMSASTGFTLPADIKVTKAELGGVPGEWVELRSEKPDRLLLYVHGGGFVACSARTHRALTSGFAEQGFRVFVPNYRLAPEHPFPAGLMDVVAVCRALHAQAAPGCRLTLAGDSAGAGLVLAALISLRDANEPLPAAAALFSPFVNLVEKGGSRRWNEGSCSLFRRKSLSRFVHLYLGNSDPRLALASPGLADLNGLPPLLIHVGDGETLLDDSACLARRARDAQVRVEFSIWPGVPHVFPIFHHFIPEGRRSLLAAGKFLRSASAVS
jgi:acetyl esterase/lipase